ncbi:MAG: DUF4229 domain-containing protein [Candidatus Nanopelagicales bacterium]
MSEPTVDPRSEPTETLPLGQQPTSPGRTTVSPGAAQSRPVPHAGLRYTMLRFAMFVAVGAVLYVIGIRGWLLLILAVLVSGIVSFFTLMRQRDAAAANLEHTVQDWNERHHRPIDSDEE